MTEYSVRGDTGGRAFPRLYARYFKRLLDVAFVIGTAPVTVPLVGILSLIIRRDGAPALYAQSRVGKDDETFTCWKLRSMVPDAETRLVEYLDQNPSARQEWDTYQKLRHDPRITPIGRLIRKSSLDELPQLWCVLKGEMSLVGPRPFLPQQQSQYEGGAYYKLRPGITGHWQVSDRNDTSFASRADYNAEYYKRLSFVTDLKVLVKTVLVVFRAEGV